MYSWDAENRLVRVSNGVWVVTEDLKLVSDPVWFGRHIAELNATNHAVVRSYVWGLDLSETLDGAGGVGGLLWVRIASGPASGTHFVTYDGNGNVWQLVSASTGTETARYEYGPFGEPLRATGPAAPFNPFRFSTKRTCNATELALYEYRAYEPSLGRWVSRDPLNEMAFARLRERFLKPWNEVRRDLCYVFAGNNGTGCYDPLGLWYDFVSVYYRSCAAMHELGSSGFCDCVCAPITTPDVAKDCEGDCKRCADVLARGMRGRRVSPHSWCLCLRQLGNKRAAKRGRPCVDCAQVCRFLEGV